MTLERINNAVEVIKYAIKYGISVKEASIKCGYANTYIKNVKRAIIGKYEDGVLEEELYDKFMNSYERYESSQRLDTKSKNEIKDIIDGEKTNITQDGDLMTIEWTGQNGSNPTNETIQNPTAFTSTYNYNEELLNEDELFIPEDAPTHGGYPVGHIKTLEGLLKSSDVDLKEWKVERHTINKWDVTSWKLGYAQTWENYQVKASLVRIKEVSEGKKISEIFKELVKEYKPPIVKAHVLPMIHKNTKPIENNLLEVNLFDLHIGKLGWAGEVGENYDTKIAVARFHDAINNLLQRAKGFEYSRILFPIGNDFFNSDNMHNTTTAGTPQDEDLRWQKTFKMGCQLIIDGVNMLKASGVPIDILVIPGNHDFERSYYLGTVMEAWFKDDKQININNGANPRKYYEFGQVLIGLTHGNEEKETSLPLLMASEQKEAWGRTTFHEWHLGHFHRKRNVKYTVFDKGQMLNEDLGVIVRYLSSLSGTEEWHFKKGYVGTHKAGEAFIWNDNSGMVGHLNFNFMNYDREH